MLKRKSMILGLALLGTVLIGGLGFFGCHKPPGFCCGGFHGEEFSKHVLEKMDTKVKDLELTESQEEAYQEIRTKVQNRLVEMAIERKALFEEVKEEMDKDAPDLQVLADLLKSRSQRFPDRMAFFVNQFMDLYKVLDAEQKGKVMTHIKEKFKKFEAFRALVCD